MAFLDLTQQLLALFILLFGMSQLDKARMGAIAREFREIAGTPLPAPEKSQFLPWITTEFKDILTPGGAVVASVEGIHVLVSRTREGVRITIEGDTIFSEGSAEIPPRGRAVIREICALLAGTYNKMEVRGYTSAVPQDAIDQDHWRLGYQRAYNVTQLLIAGGVARPRVRLSSGGDNDPLASNLVPELRGRNRRVEIIVSEEIWDPNE